MIVIIIIINIIIIIIIYTYTYTYGWLTQGFPLLHWKYLTSGTFFVMFIGEMMINQWIDVSTGHFKRRIYLRLF